MADHPFHDAAMALPRMAPPNRGGGNRPPRMKMQGTAPKKKGHRPTDGKRHSDKGHGGHGHNEAAGASAKNHGAKRDSSKASGAKKRTEPSRSGPNQGGGGNRPLKANRRGGNAPR